jgi:CRP-like cAMP-binding protein
MRAPVLSLKASVFDVTLKLDHSLIADLPVFGGLAPEALDEILAGAHARHYAKGVPVFSQNEIAHSYFLLLHGRLRVTQVTPNGEQIVVRFVSPGDLFGVAMAIRSRHVSRDRYRNRRQPRAVVALSDMAAADGPASRAREQCHAHDRRPFAGSPSTSARDFDRGRRKARRSCGSQIGR